MRVVHFFWVLFIGVMSSPIYSESVNKLVQSCAACHGAKGISLIDQNPSLANQGERYLFTQLKMIQSGERSIPTMTGQLDNLTESDLKKIAVYYAAQKELPVVQVSDKNLALGERIYRSGLPKKGVVACVACHGESGKGLSQAGYPSLRGQSFGYLVKQLKDYREQRRQTDINGVMRLIATGLTDTEMEAVSNYVRGLYDKK